jgi:predicted DNA-binding antitoxin AbrB/MazE fold protein
LNGGIKRQERRNAKGAAAEFAWAAVAMIELRSAGAAMTVRAVYENGVFRPTEPVDLPEKSEVEIILPAPSTDADANLDAIYKILGESYASGETDVAERHNEHQP